MLLRAKPTDIILSLSIEVYSESLTSALQSHCPARLRGHDACTGKLSWSSHSHVVMATWEEDGWVLVAVETLLFAYTDVEFSACVNAD